ncbi:Filament-forming protein [Coemansia asiatica]|nr:Filament-forming protein [Coemansia asiatica]
MEGDPDITSVAATAAETVDGVEQAKAQLQYENTRLENEVHRLNRQIGQLKSSLDGAQSENRAAKDELQSTKTQAEELKASLQTQSIQLSAHVEKETEQQKQLDQLREEKRDLLAQIAERRDELDGRSTEISRLNEIVQDLQKQRLSDQEELSRLRSQCSVSDVSEHMLKQSLELAKGQVKWLDEELAKAQAEMQNARTELARNATTGKAENTRLYAEIESLTEQTDELRQRNAQLERTVRARSEGERLARDQLAEQAEQFKREMAAQKKLCAEWERTTLAAKEHVREVEKSLHELEMQQRENEERAQEAVELMENRVAEKDRECAQLKEKQAATKAELDRANKLLEEATRSQAVIISPTASAAARLQQGSSRLSITQLYADKVALEDRVRNAEAEAACLRESMEQILTEIEERAPALAAEREEHESLLADADRIAQELATTRKECTSLAASLQRTQKERDLAQRQLAAEQQQSRDLERQLARLLRVAEEARRGGTVMPDKRSEEDSAAAVVPDESDDSRLDEVERVISQNLVVYSDITELVAQNRRLLRTTRELAVQVAQEEENQRVKAENETQNALDQAEEMLDRLTLELEGAKKRMGIVERERDMLRELKADNSETKDILPQGEKESQGLAAGYTDTSDAPNAATTDSESLASLQADFDAYVGEARRTRAQLETDLAKLQQESSELRVRAAKAEAQSQFDADRIDMLSRDLDARQKEIDHLRKATARLYKQSETYEKQIENMGQSMNEERVELSRLRRQAVMLEAECESLRQGDQRWRAEEQRLRAERTSMTQILENTTRMREDMQRATEEKTRQLQERLDAARADVDSARQDLRQARDAAERAQFKYEADLRELRAQMQQRDESIQQLQAQILAAKDMQAETSSERREAEIAADMLKRQIADLEERIRAQDELVERARGSEGNASRESLLSVQLQDARSQLETLNSELETTRQRAEDFRQLAAASDASLKEITEIYDKYKAEHDKLSEEHAARASELEASANEAAASLAKCQTDLNETRESLREAHANIAKIQTDYEARVSGLEDDVKNKALTIGSLKGTLQKREDSIRSLQEQYEKEVVMHADVIKSSLVTREKLLQTKKLLSEATGELQGCHQVVSKLEEQLQEARASATSGVRETESRLAEVRRQNSLLLAHLESLGREVPDIAIDPEQIASATSASNVVGEGDQGDGNASVSQSGLRDVVVYLRRERDLATAQLELAQQESQRWRQQSAHTQQMLDEVRNELMQYTPAIDINNAGNSSTGDASQTSMGSSSDRTGSTAGSAAEVIPAGDGPITLTAMQRRLCRQHIEQVQILRESNTALRSDLTSARRRLTNVESALSQLRDQEVPQLRSANVSLSAELDAAKAQVNQLQGMCDHWKQRHENVLAKYQMIEPEEYEALKKQNQELQSQVEQLNTRIGELQAENQQLEQSLSETNQQKASAETRRTKQLHADIAKLKQQITTQETQLANERQRLAEHEAQMTALRNDLSSRDAALENASKEASDNKAKFDKLHSVFQKLREQSVEKLKQSNSTIAAHEATIKSLNSQIEALQSQMQTDGDAVGSQAPASSGLDPEILGRLQSEIAALTQDKEQAVGSYEKLASDLRDTQRALDEARMQLSQSGQEQQQQQMTSAAAQSSEGTGVSSDGAQAMQTEISRLKSELAAAEAKVKEYEDQLEQLKARALKYARDNKVLQAKTVELEKKLSDISASSLLSGDGGASAQADQLQLQLEQMQKQLTESETKIEQAQVKAKKSAELRSMLQINKANKRASELEKQVEELQAKISTLESETGSLKRPMEAEDGPVKKPHIEEAQEQQPSST